MEINISKWKVIGVLIVSMFCAAAFAYADVSIDSSNYNNWEQNSYRPLRVNYTTGTSYSILGFDAHLQYNNNANNFGVPTMSNEIPLSVLESADKNLSEDTTPPSHIKYTRSTSQAKYWSTGTGTVSIYDLNFQVLPSATLGSTTFNWYTAGIKLLGTPAPGVDVTGSTPTRTVTITSSVPPVWNGSNTGINSKGSPVTSPNTGNMLQVTWDKTQVTDDTPYGITPTTYDNHNLVFKVYRSRSDAPGTFTLMNTTAAGGTSYNDGNANGQYEGNEPYDCCPPHNYSYTYKLHAVDNTIGQLEDANAQTYTIKSHDTTAPGVPTSSSQAAPAQMYWTNNGTTWTGGNSFTGYVPGDKSVTLKWASPGDADLAGYAVVGSDATAWGSAALGSASGDTNGPNYVAGNTVGTNGTVLAMQAALQITRTKLKDGTTDLQNGVPYYYNISAYDLAEEFDGVAGAGQQGRNYSTTLQIVAIPGVAPSVASSVLGTKTSSGLTVHWTNPPEAYFDGIRIVVKVGSNPSDPGDGTVVYEQRGLTPSNPMSYTITTAQCPNPLTTDYRVAVFTHNLAGGGDPTVITKRRYSAAAMASYDTTPPGSVSLLYAIPQTSTSLQLTWANPSDSDFSGIVILRKPGTSEFLTGSLEAGVPHALHDTIVADETVAFVGSAEMYSDPGLTTGQQYYYRAWAYDTSLNYSSNFDLTGSIPGGGLGSFFAGPTTIFPGWNNIATGQQTLLRLDQSSLTLEGASTGDKMYQLIPGTKNYNLATVNSSNQWIDQDLGAVATWEMAPDAGFFFERNTNSPLTWEAR
jgi:hypothetical protein